MRKLILATVVGALVWAAGPTLTGIAKAQAQTEIDYFGKNLFLGVAYHRYGCSINGPYSNSTVNTSNTYQGFTGTQYCNAGWTWDQENNAASTYYGYTNTGNLSDAWLGYYYGYANWDYGLGLTGGYASNASSGADYCHSWATNYADNRTQDISSRSVSGAPNGCSYSVLTNCNSDCWIADFSTRQGAIVPTLSPCF